MVSVFHREEDQDNSNKTVPTPIAQELTQGNISVDNTKINTADEGFYKGVGRHPKYCFKI